MAFFGIPNGRFGLPKCAQTTRLNGLQIKASKPKDKNYVLTDGDSPLLRMRSNRLSLVQATKKSGTANPAWNWQIQESPIHFKSDAVAYTDATHSLSKQNVFYRSDTKASLSVVSPYKSQLELSLEKTGRDTHCRTPIHRMRKARCTGQFLQPIRPKPPASGQRCQWSIKRAPSDLMQ
ncbi:hypothetical protein C1Y26_08745 [Pseudomonas sp. MPR-R2A7]|nr:hypothetical protein C1Y23_09330 [Pseudomonas sp. GW460-12]PMX29195.1 hypothetical protein C1Y24_32650 [Pseudomonas sp. MPR-R2A4]PMX41854.1 hypothetical protein C1Y26_08745 [Pseudomonas sp. MPR-R2A7]PMX46791.1 hypothetical protein C1Y17_32390 [Pseudomonas sp. MPR-R2A6]PMX91291.1 hypothetical protein C1Y21_11695 [Pseudomonas sp. MPR-R2A3]PMY14342.1 hypothetical protein C1Y22_09245 [Pseudomonas sp. MPR-R2A5]PNA34933.1 hypothetical protein C1Y16_11060 [Pseudomonas sp. MPR-ANB1]PNA37631.1 hyp